MSILSPRGYAAVFAAVVSSLAGPEVLAAGPAGPGLPAALPAARLAAPAPVTAKPTARRGVGARSAALTAIDRANARARDVPTPGAYVNSAVYYDFEPGRLYTIHTSPRFLTTIQLRPGERLIAKAAGDTVRWVLGETQSGSGEAAQVIVFVKPIRPDLRTNIVLTTDQRTYLIDAVSNGAATYTSVLTWNYPQEAARDLAATAARAAVREVAGVVGSVPLDRLNFAYRIDAPKGRAPAWRPSQVFDDGTKTFIAFPPDLAAREAPPLFLVGDKGQAELVNYRVSGAYYIVDRLIDRAELRLGQGRGSIVRITRLGGRG